MRANILESDPKYKPVLPVDEKNLTAQEKQFRRELDNNDY